MTKIKQGGKVDPSKLVGKKRYPKEVREAVRARICALQYRGERIKDITQIMQNEGYKCPQGNVIQEYHVNNQLFAVRKIAENAAKKRRENKAAAKVTSLSNSDQRIKNVLEVQDKIRSAVLPAIVEQILVGKGSAERKVAMVRAYYEI